MHCTLIWSCAPQELETLSSPQAAAQRAILLMLSGVGKAAFSSDSQQLASKLFDSAKNGQVLLDGRTVEQLGGILKASTRLVARLPEADVYEFVWKAIEPDGPGTTIV